MQNISELRSIIRHLVVEARAGSAQPGVWMVADINGRVLSNRRRKTLTGAQKVADKIGGMPAFIPASVGIPENGDVVVGSWDGDTVRDPRIGPYEVEFLRVSGIKPAEYAAEPENW